MKWNNGWEEGMLRMPKTATNKRDGTKKKCATLFVKRNDRIMLMFIRASKIFNEKF